ncbi:MAG: hypothetical protein HKN79_11970, partial [Flavobacteriales bacterium]|nr:hypothetical protein [Flavobacteriales bacterium]
MDLNRLITRLSGSFDQVRTVKWLRWGLYALVAYSIIILGLPMHELLWGEYSLIAPMSFPDLWTHDVIMFLHDEDHRAWYPLFVILPFIGMALILFKRWTRFGALLVFLGTSILFNRTYTFLTGGNYLLHILLFYLVFIDEYSSG